MKLLSEVELYSYPEAAYLAATFAVLVDWYEAGTEERRRKRRRRMRGWEGRDGGGMRGAGGGDRQ